MCLKMKYAIVLLAAAVVPTARAQQPAAVDEYAGLTDEQIVHRGFKLRHQISFIFSFGDYSHKSFALRSTR